MLESMAEKMEPHCAIRGNCGKRSFFGSELPCPYDGEPQKLNNTDQIKLISICGTEWEDQSVCCSADQVASLEDSLAKARPLISSCPACEANFVKLFCDFTCSPDQSQFLRVVDTGESSSGQIAATEINYYVSDYFAQTFYNSCKDVKFSATNGYVMDFIGGGAKNASSFLKFLGDEKPLVGSPFQLNFPDQTPSNYSQMNSSVFGCSTSDSLYRCACVDCPESCPSLPHISDNSQCTVGSLPCASFTLFMIYTGIILSLVFTHLYSNFWKHPRNIHIRLQDGAHSPQELLNEDDQFADWDAPTIPPKKPIYPVNKILERFFQRVGYYCSSKPIQIIPLSLFFAALISIGWKYFKVETDPAKLWSSSSSNAAIEKEYFETNFGPFYRAEQIFLVNDTGSVLNHKDTFDYWFDLEDRIRTLEVTFNGTNITLEDICFNPTREACVVQSITQYWGGNIGLVGSDWKKALRSCIEHPTECLPPFGQPLDKSAVLGGYLKEDALTAKALVSSIVVDNHLDPVLNMPAMKWEEELKNMLLNESEKLSEMGLRLSFSAEISLEQELSKSSNSDARIISISYIVMFLYSSLALGGSLFKGKRALVESRFLLGLCGICIVLISVIVSVGFFSLFGIHATLIIAEVIPFLILAIGVDNIFLIAHELERVNETHMDEKVEDRVARALSRIGPSIIFSSTAEALTFALGITVSMPAVRNFAIYATGAVVINTILQTTLFISFLTLDQKRIDSSRADVIPIIRIQTEPIASGNLEGQLAKFIRTTYAPTIMMRNVKVTILTFFIGYFAISCALIPDIALGLDQNVAIPSDSYLISYFDDLKSYFSQGPPVYFVVKDTNTTERSNQQLLCGRFSTCQEYSLLNILEQERNRSELSFISQPTASWIDDFLLWLNPTLDECCLQKEDGSFCSSLRPGCHPCYADDGASSHKWNITMEGLPEGSEFLNYAHAWLSQMPDDSCPLSGKAGYSNAVVLDDNSINIKTSHFRTAHPPLRAQTDYIDAYKNARRISSEIESYSGHRLKVFPYSVFYIFFEQYINIVQNTIFLLLAGFIGIFLISSILLGSIRNTIVLLLTTLMILVDIMGVMVIAQISLNAISLVNLVICMGIAVEFCAHIVRAFTFSETNAHISMENQRSDRAISALCTIGSSVISGITLTKLTGVIVLAFTSSKIFDIYYFRMWFALVILASLHSIVFLPVALELAGSETGYALEDKFPFEEEWRFDNDQRYSEALLHGDGWDSDNE